MPAPLARVSTCGGLKLEVLHEVISTHPPQGHYQVVTLEGRPKGSSTGLTLLKVLTSLPEQYASKDWLTEHLPRTRSNEDDDDEWGRGLVRVDNVVSLLRSLLCPSGIAEEETIRKLLVAYVKNHRDSGPGYRLALEPLLWLDVNVIAVSTQRAVLLEQQEKEALPYWEQAYALASKGGYLPDEPYSDWAKDKRSEVEGYLRQAVHALCRLFLAYPGEAGEERVLLLLRTYWHTHPTDEDALRPLLELLGKHNRVQEAWGCYQHLCKQLEQEGSTPDPRTQKIAQSLMHSGQSTYAHARENVRLLTVSSMLSSHQSALPTPSSHSDTDNHSVEPSFNSAFLNPTGIPVASTSFLRTDVDILAHLSILLNKSSIVNEREIGYFDQQTRLYWRAREETALPATTLYTYVIRHIDDITLLLARSHLLMLRPYLYEITCRTVLLAGILLYDMGQYTQARQHYLLAFQAASEANNLVLQAIVWGWMSFTWTYIKNYMEALDCVHYARSFAMQTTNSVTQAWLGAIEAEIQAHLHNQDACLQSLNDMEHNRGNSPSHDVSYLFEFNPVLLLGYKGVCLQQLYQRQKPATYRFLQEAKESLEQALASDAPIKRKLYYLTDLAGVHARQGEAERACSYLIQSLPLITQVGSGSKTICRHLLQARVLLQPYEHTSFVQALDNQMAPFLIEKQTEGA